MAVAAGIVGVVAVVAVAGVLVLGRVPTPSQALGAPRFVEETATAGLVHTYDGGPTFATGGGVAVLDCDEDGRPDLYVAGGANAAQLFRNGSDVGGGLVFTPAGDEVTDVTGVTGAYPLDVDADGHTDLAVLRVGETLMLRGLGDCRFERANEAWGLQLPSSAWTTAFSATWEVDQTLPTLAVGNYLELDPSGEPTNACATSELYRPGAAGTGYGAPITLEPGYCTLSMLFSDWDGSGRRDLRVTNDRHYYTAGSDQLWRIAAGRGTPCLHRGRRLGAHGDLGHGHRRPGPDGRRPARVLPHQPGRQQAADADAGPEAADLPRHRASAGRDGGPAVHGR